MADWNPAISDSKNRLDFQPKQQNEGASSSTTPFHNELHKQSYLKSFVDTFAAPFCSNPETRSEVDNYGAEFLKTATLFLRGRLGLAGSVVSYGLDQARPGDTLSEQLSDGVLGGVKGAAMQRLFGKLGGLELDFATKGMVLGTSSRVVDSALNRNTFTDEHGTFSFSDGVSKITNTAFNPAALTADIVTFGIAHGAFRGANALSGNALDRSPMLSTILTGTTFGASSGAWGEIQRERANGEDLSISSITKHALIQGGLNSIAAAPGGIQARAFAISEGGLTTPFNTRVTDLSLGAKLAETLGLNRGVARASDGVGPRTANDITPTMNDPQAFKFAMAKVRPEDLAGLTKSIIDTTDGAAREQLLSSLRMYSLAQVEPQQALRTAEDIFHQVASLPAGESKAAGSLWEMLPESKQTGEPGLRAALADTLAPGELAKIVFGNNESIYPVAQELAARNPELIRAAAKAMPYVEQDAHTKPVADTIEAYYFTNSLSDSVNYALARTQGEKPTGQYPPAASLVEQMYERATPEERIKTLNELKDAALRPIHPNDEARTALAIDIAARLAEKDPVNVDAHFFRPLQNALNSGELGFHWQQFVSTESKILEDTGKLPKGMLESPELKLRAAQSLDPNYRDNLRARSEQALRDPQQMLKMLGEGELGRLFPTVFGTHAEGGIVGRPQHKGHEFSLDDHTMHVVNNVRTNPEFANLSEKDQTNLLWAAILHDVGKRPNEYSPGHEQVSAAMAWSVLETLGYPTQRIQRITNLLADHQLMSYLPDPEHLQLLDQPTMRDYLSTRYGHDSALQQLRILNESDIRALDSGSTYWTPTVQQELDRRTDVVNTRANELAQNSIPVLTSELPHEFKVIEQPGNYALLVGADGRPDAHFFRSLSDIESRTSSAPVTLVTPESVPNSVPSGGNVVAIMSGPAEQVKAIQQGMQTAQAEALRRQLSQFDTIEDLHKSGDASAQQAHDALLQSVAGQRLGLNNPAFSGIGIIRNGRPVVFEGLTNAKQIGMNSQPSWMQMYPTPNAVVVPQVVWRNAQALNVPIVMMD
jgi:hypothetical protein